LILLLIAFLSSGFLILINYFTIRTISTVRAYTNGESRYSKGQKDAARHLIMYVNTADERYWNSFLKEIAVPIGDSIARTAMQRGLSTDIIWNGFQAGKNHPEDISNMIWLFQNFKNISFMKDAIRVWKEADQLVGEEYSLGKAVRAELSAGKMPDDRKFATLKRINEVTAELTVKEEAFSDLMGWTARRISMYLFLANILMTLIIVGSAGAYAWVMIGRQRNKTNDLIAINEDLDKFVYSVSHDLRAPINSLKGLIEIMKAEQEPVRFNQYLGLMEQSLNKQDQFIHDIIASAKNKQENIQQTTFSLTTIIDEAITHHRYMESAKEIHFQKEIMVDLLKSDPVRLGIILNNIISNAIKYCDRTKKDCYVKIKTYPAQDCAVLEIEDNGIGIKPEYQARIFDMFFMTKRAHNGSGLGLYITKENVEKLRGTIEVKSESYVGSTFIVRIPLC
jgi:signal transduction histidine kinase